MSFLCIKGLDINTDLISAKGYTNAGVDCLKIEETGELWVSIKNAGNGLGVKNILVIIKLSFKRNIWYLWKKRINKRRN